MIQGRDPLLEPGAKAGRRASPQLPSGDTNCHASTPSPPTTSAPVRLIKQSLDDALPVDSTGNVAHRLCASGSERPDEKSGVPWSV